MILLDLTRRGIQGLEVLRWLHAAGPQTPILMVPDLAELDHKIKGLGFSADDFLTRPFDRREFRAGSRRQRSRRIRVRNAAAGARPLATVCRSGIDYREHPAVR